MVLKKTGFVMKKKFQDKNQSGELSQTLQQTISESEDFDYETPLLYCKAIEENTYIT